MRKSVLAFLLLLTVVALTHAATQDGTIAFDCPNVPNAKVQFHFTCELIALAVTTPPFNTVEDIYIQIYDDEVGIYDKLVRYYGEKFEVKNWRSIQENNWILLYILEGTDTQSLRADNTVMGVFAVVKGDEEVYLLNIVGGIPSQQIHQLLANLGELSIDIPDLKSFPALEIDEQPLSSPTGFQTADGFPIYEVQIQGNQKIDTSEILETLEAGDENIEKAGETLQKKMSSKLEEVETSIKEENGKHLAVITVKERSTSRSSGSIQAIPMIRFNRVSGWKLGATVKTDLTRARFSNGMPTSNIFGYTGYGFGNKIMDYEIGIDTMPFATYTQFNNNPGDDTDKWYHGFGINAKVHDTTDIIPNNVTARRITNNFNAPFGLFYSIAGAEDLHNYYSRRGFEIAFRWQKLPRLEYTSPMHLVTLTLFAENHESLQKSTDWHLFNWRSRSKARENPAITPGHIRSVMFKYDLNLRTSYLGWHNTFSVEHSNAAFSSDFDFTRYQLLLRYAHPLGKHRIRTRAVGSFSTASLPIQRQFTIGGPGVLNGYPLYAFSGDHGFLFNIEFFYNLPQLSIWKNLQINFDPDIFFVFFVDAGQTWDVVTDETFTLLPKSDAGIGLQFGEDNFILRFNVAKAVESEQGMQFNIVWFYSF